MKKLLLNGIIILLVMSVMVCLSSCGGDNDDNISTNSTTPIPESVAQFVGYWSLTTQSAGPDMKIIFLNDGYCLMAKNTSTVFEPKEWTYDDSKKMLVTTDYQWDNITMLSEQTWTGTAMWQSMSPYTATRDTSSATIFPILASGTWVCKSDSTKKFKYNVMTNSYNRSKYIEIEGINPKNKESLTGSPSQFFYDAKNDVMTHIYKYSLNRGNPAQYTFELKHPYSYKKRTLHVKYELGYSGDYHYLNDPFDEIFELKN